MELFTIDIVEQGWLDGSSSEQDLCSHGRIKLVIDDQLISPADEEYGISESALALLRTLEHDHSPEHPIAERLIFHGCGTMLMLGCPIGFDWSVEHVPGQVRIANVVRYDTTSESDAVHFPDLAVEVPDEQYRQQIVKFADEAKTLFDGITKTFYDDEDRERYEEFWAEFETLLSRARHKS